MVQMKGGAGIASPVVIAERKTSSTSASKKAPAPSEARQPSAQRKPDAEPAKAEGNEAIRLEHRQKFQSAMSNMDREGNGNVDPEKAVNFGENISMADLTEMKAPKRPPLAVAELAKTVLLLLGKDKRNLNWKQFQKAAGNPGALLQEMQNLDVESVEQWRMRSAQQYALLDWFDVAALRKASQAAAELAIWVLAVIEYHDVLEAHKQALQENQPDEQPRASNDQIDLQVSPSMPFARAVEQDSSQDNAGNALEKAQSVQEALDAQKKDVQQLPVEAPLFKEEEDDQAQTSMPGA